MAFTPLQPIQIDKEPNAYTLGNAIISSPKCCDPDLDQELTELQNAISACKAFGDLVPEPEAAERLLIDVFIQARSIDSLIHCIDIKDDVHVQIDPLERVMLVGYLSDAKEVITEYIEKWPLPNKAWHGGDGIIRTSKEALQENLRQIERFILNCQKKSTVDDPEP